MTVTLKAVEPARPAGKWPMPAAPHFLEAEAYRVLRRDLERYVRGEISGRSFLIAGHRGSGKTALVTRAVQDLRTELFEAAIKRPVKDGPQPLFQRPLLVKLYGPSLVSPLPPTEAEVEARKKAADAAKENGLWGEAAGAEAPSPAALKATQAALVQITIALYRALAGELAEGYGVHAREQERRRGGEPLELAAQFALELDSATAPALLRSYWSRVSRLGGGGILWPLEADVHGPRRTQGFKEVVSVASAGQAFEVCSGAINLSIKTVDKALDEHNLSGRGSTNLRDVVGRVGTLGVGALTGAALWTPANETTAVIAGAAVWLLGTATLSWDFKRERSVDRTADYTFIRDRSVQTLDRDLPLVIQRVRDAGLSPVFVIDELDKLNDPDNTVGDLIRRLKHIVADHGFFCFLTDRRYFDYVEGKTDTEPFPREHTYFTERRLIAYSPAELREFIRGEFELTNATEAEIVTADIFALWAVHSGKANFVGAMRELGRLVADAKGEYFEVSPAPSIPPRHLTLTLARMAARFDVKLAATIQLAIEEVLTEPRFANRISQDPAFAQLAHDALYALSRGWDAGETTYDTTAGALQTHLVARLVAAQDPTETPPARRTTSTRRPTVSDGDAELLSQANKSLIAHLSDLDVFATRIERSEDEGRARLASMIPRATGGLLQRTRGQKFRFNYSCYGHDLRPEAASRNQEIELLIQLVDEFQGLLKDFGVTLQDLISARLMPPTLNWQAIVAARNTLLAYHTAPGQPVVEPLSTLQALRDAMQQHGPLLAAGLRLARSLNASAGATT